MLSSGTWHRGSTDDGAGVGLGFGGGFTFRGGRAPSASCPRTERPKTGTWGPTFPECTWPCSPRCFARRCSPRRCCTAPAGCLYTAGPAPSTVSFLHALLACLGQIPQLLVIFRLSKTLQAEEPRHVWPAKSMMLAQMWSGVPFLGTSPGSCRWTLAARPSCTWLHLRTRRRRLERVRGVPTVGLAVVEPDCAVLGQQLLHVVLAQRGLRAERDAGLVLCHHRGWAVGAQSWLGPPPPPLSSNRSLVHRVAATIL